jgi:hypothetical protein
MNPYRSFSDLLFSCVDAPHVEVAATILAVLNEPRPSELERLLSTPGVRVVGPISNFPRKLTVRYFSKETPLDFSLAYINEAEIDTTKTLRIVFWEPRIHPGRTVFIGNFRDGLSHMVFATSVDSPRTWINVRIYDDPDYPGCVFDYYSDRRNILRSVMACKDEQGWDFAQEGSIQPFENPGYYERRLKKDRLNRAIITEYMEKLGFMIAMDGFWETDKPASYDSLGRGEKGVGESNVTGNRGPSKDSRPTPTPFSPHFDREARNEEARDEESAV